MQRGAVVFLDALGFKGLWKSWHPEEILASLKIAASYAKEGGTPGPVSILFELFEMQSTVRVFSDTVVLAVSCSPAPDTFSGSAASPIDEAASEEKRAEGAFIWLTPSALAAFQKYTVQFGPSVVIPYYPVPMKGGHPYTTHVVNPLLSIPEPREESIRRLLETFSRSEAVEVAIKRQHTEALVECALKTLRDFERRSPSN